MALRCFLMEHGMIRIINRINIAFGENLCNSKTEEINGILTKYIYIFFLKSIFLSFNSSARFYPGTACKILQRNQGK